jgi:hypothetical protein
VQGAFDPDVETVLVGLMRTVPDHEAESDDVDHA